MGMTEASPQLLLSGALSDAVTAAMQMHAVPSGSVYWGDAAAQADPRMSAQGMSAEGLQHEGALQPHLPGPDGVQQPFVQVYPGDCSLRIQLCFWLSCHMQELCRYAEHISP